MILPTVHALQTQPRFPENAWYDAASGRYIPPEVVPADDEALRSLGRVDTSPPANVSSNQGSSLDWGWDWGWDLRWSDFGWMAEALRFLVLAVLVLMVATVIGLLIQYALRNYLPQRFRRPPQVGSIAIDPARIVDLPFEVAAADGDLLAQARACMQRADYAAAIVYLYGYWLLALDQTRHIHLHKGKTNRMYLAELSGNPQLQSATQQIVHIFERSFFGQHPVTGQQFAAVWDQLDEFHRRVSGQQPPSAAPRVATGVNS